MVFPSVEGSGLAMGRRAAQLSEVHHREDTGRKKEREKNRLLNLDHLMSRKVPFGVGLLCNPRSLCNLRACVVFTL